MHRFLTLPTYLGQRPQSWLARRRAPGLSVAGAIATGLLGLNLTPSAAYAALGEPEASAYNDTARLKASVRVTAAAQIHRVHELTLPSGTVVREFINAAGVVFAVSWRGPFKPDLPALLGSYFSTYATAARTSGSDRSHLTIDQANLVVSAGGHPRAFMGLAYVPQLMPPGVVAADLQ